MCAGAGGGPALPYPRAQDLVPDVARRGDAPHQRHHADQLLQGPHQDHPLPAPRRRHLH